MALSASISKCIFAWILASGSAQALTADEARHQLKTHRGVQFDLWKDRLKRKFNTRVTSASPFVIEYLALEGFAHGTPQPQSANFKRTFKRVFKTTLKKLSPEIHKILHERVAGVLAVKNLGVTGKTIPVRDSNGKIVAALIVIDVDRAKMKLNDFATSRDAGLFQSGEYSVQVKLKADTTSRTTETINYVFLHEIGRVLGLFTHHIPQPGQEPSADWKRLDFLNMSWIAPRYLADKFGGFPSGMKLEFFKAPAPNPNAKLPEVYEWLEKTNYPTLFAATDFHEDFAESFVNWARLKRLKRPYTLSVYRGSKLVKTYLSCFSSRRCDDKAAIFATLWPEPKAKPVSADKKAQQNKKKELRKERKKKIKEKKKAGFTTRKELPKKAKSPAAPTPPPQPGSQ